MADKTTDQAIKKAKATLASAESLYEGLKAIKEKPPFVDGSVFVPQYNALHKATMEVLSIDEELASLANHLKPMSLPDSPGANMHAYSQGMTLLPELIARLKNFLKNYVSDINLIV